MCPRLQPHSMHLQARQLNAFEQLLAQAADGPLGGAADEWSRSFASSGQYRGAPPLRPTFGSDLRERTAAAAADARERAAAALSSARERLNDRVASSVADRAPHIESAKGSMRSLGGRAADSLRALPSRAETVKSRGLSAVVGAPAAPPRSAGDVFPSGGAPSSSATAAATAATAIAAATVPGPAVVAAIAAGVAGVAAVAGAPPGP